VFSIATRQLSLAADVANDFYIFRREALDWINKGDWKRFIPHFSKRYVIASQKLGMPVFKVMQCCNALLPRLLLHCCLAQPFE
jgi:hypothetical protein